MRRSFETGWPCPWYYDANGNSSLEPLPGFEPCTGWVDSNNQVCAPDHPQARKEHGILESPKPSPFDHVTMEKRRKKRCIFCDATDKTYEKSYGDQKPGTPGGVYSNHLDNRPRLFDVSEYH